MHIDEIRVQNLRAVKDCTMSLGPLTALVGPNGAGKSTFLHALLLFHGRLKATIDDFYNGDTGQDISIQIAFGGLSEQAKDTFSEHVRDSRLYVSCVIRWAGDRPALTFHSCPPSNPDFDAVRNAPDEEIARSIYEILYRDPRYGRLPAWTCTENAEQAMLEWERQNPSRCVMHPLRQELRVHGMLGMAYVGRYVQFRAVPAVRDAAAGKGGMGPVLEEMLYMAAKQASAGGTKAIYDRLEAEVNEMLGRIDAGAEIGLAPAGDGHGGGGSGVVARLVEDRYSPPVGSAGHGLQRALIITVLLHYLSRSAAAATPGGIFTPPDEPPSLVFAIEEPELYQHPTRMRQLASLLQSMSKSGAGNVAGRVQVVYTTHSRHFVSAGRVDQVRLVRKMRPRGGGPMVASVASTTLAEIMAELERHGTARVDGTTACHRILHAMDPAASEGLFARAVVLVEGESDRIAIESAAEILGRPLDALGVQVVQCGSKSSIPLPLVMFRKLGMLVYVVWDADGNEGRQRKENERILSALGHEGGEWRGRVCASFACLSTNLEDAIDMDLKKEIGGGGHPYDRISERRGAPHGRRGSGSKPLKTRMAMDGAKDGGLHLETLEAIVKQIIRMAEDGGSA